MQDDRSIEGKGDAPTTGTRPRHRRPSAVRAPAGLEAITKELEAFGLSPHQAQVLSVLLDVPSNGVELAELLSISKNNVYRLIEQLTAMGLVQRLPGEGASRWTAAGREEIFDRLYSLHQERLKELATRAARAKELLAKSPPRHRGLLPFVHVIPTPSETQQHYDRLLAATESELLMFTRPPYVARDEPDQAVLEALARGVEMRVLYLASAVIEPDAEPWRERMDVYHRAGVQPRVIDELPIKLTVLDRRVVLVAMLDTDSEPSYPTFLRVDHEGFARVQAEGFERMWARSLPYERPVTDNEESRIPEDSTSLGYNEDVPK